MSLIELEGVSVRQGSTPILQEISLAVDEGDSLGLVGPNGCGKSVLLKAMATLVRPSSGRVLICDFDTRFDAPQVRRRIGYVPDQLGVYPGLTVWQYLNFFARMAGVPAVERKSSVETLLTVVDLFDRRQLEVERLSRGMCRRLALARALVHNPSVLLLDDPLAGLDGRGRLELIEVLKELRGMGLTVVLSGHLLGDIVELCSHVAILRQGHVIRHCPVEQLEGVPGEAPSRIEIGILLGHDVARAALARMAEVRDLELSGQTLTFAFHGDAAALATVLDQLVQEGVQIAHFGPGARRYDELAAGLVELENRPTG